MVHQTMATRTTRASKASSRINSMRQTWRWLGPAILGTLAGCGGVPLIVEQGPAGPVPPQAAADVAAPAAAPADGPVLVRGRSRWVPVGWEELPGFEEDALHEAWNAWLKSCERPPAPLAALCPQVRQLAIAPPEEQRAWLRRQLQPYRVESHGGAAEGLLTAYYEPVFEARRQAAPGFGVPLYAPPPGLGQRRPWHTRQEIDTQPVVRAQLQGREIAWLADPVDALVLQIQGSGRLRLTEPDGQRKLVRLAYAATNDQPYRSVGSWLLQQGAVRDASWPGIKAWVRANPQRVQEMLWSNPRVVFFREEPLAGFDAAFGPRGAQGVPLTPGRSIAVDRESVPYGTPVWLASTGPQLELRRLVLAQDTGSAIVGAVRVDWFTGWGQEAGELAGRLKQPVRMWVLWPRGGPPPG
ncbi:MltA domain-containing protein [Ramlibacter sp. AW1]|uniref:peptidoglycan lytic exotransglycosylase n=1 Tax=Ramlibacter aurantiacus TaxID=2801330 RepID=A0A936ZJY9_9BURK|nr:MltA domain-containing protein [Ramlibacter aurantiacus]MBL0421187.1 MltA domain-containing protein [Ramlibacter aurantiacus]